MITLDTNQFRSADVLGAKMLRLHGVAARHRIPLAITETVLAEVLASYGRDVELQLTALTTSTNMAKREEARRRLLGLVPLWNTRPEFARGDDTAVPTVKWAVDRQEQRLKQMFRRVLAKPIGADAEGTAREISRTRPALASGGSGKGARDSVIWLTVLAAGRDLPQGNMYFAARDKGFDLPLHPDLVQEAYAKGVPYLRFFEDFDGIVDELSSPADLPKPVNELAAMDEILSRVRNYLQDGNFRMEIADWLPVAGGSPMETREDDIEALNGSGDELACRIGATTIVAFTQIWKVTRYYGLWTRDAGLGDERSFAFTIKLGLVANFEAGSLTAVYVVNRGGILEAA